MATKEQGARYHSNCIDFLICRHERTLTKSNRYSSLREQSRPSGAKEREEVDVTDRSTGKASKGFSNGHVGGRKLREITLTEPIRYAQGDSVESWLYKLLCLDATLPRPRKNTNGCPSPETCQLLQINRDTLFSFHPVAEKMLSEIVGLYVASHYKVCIKRIIRLCLPAYEIAVELSK